MNLTLPDIFLLAFAVFGSAYLGYLAGQIKERKDANRAAAHKAMQAQRNAIQEDLARKDVAFRTAAMIATAEQSATRYPYPPNPMKTCACGRQFELGLMCNFCALDRSSPGMRMFSATDVGLFPLSQLGSPVMPDFTPAQTNKGEQGRNSETFSEQLNRQSINMLRTQVQNGEQDRKEP